MGLEKYESREVWIASTPWKISYVLRLTTGKLNHIVTSTVKFDILKDGECLVSTE